VISPTLPDDADGPVRILPADDTGTAGDRTVVLLHARPTDRSMWDGYLPVLAAAGWRAIAMDLPGYGEAVVTDGRTIQPWSAVLATLDALGVDRAVLVGNSLGAMVALQLAVAHPERVKGLVAVGYRPHDQPASGRLQSVWDAERSATARDDLDEAVRAGVAAWTAPATGAAVKTAVARMLRNNLDHRRRYGEPDTGEDPLQHPDALQLLDVPALVAVGELDMPDFFSGGESLVRDLNAGQVVCIPGAAHLAPLDQPAAFAELLLNFLLTLDGPRW
jgi:pimeloyl-ACP methyl ester carboxylesterase